VCEQQVTTVVVSSLMGMETKEPFYRLIRIQLKLRINLGKNGRQVTCQPYLPLLELNSHSKQQRETREGDENERKEERRRKKEGLKNGRKEEMSQSGRLRFRQDSQDNQTKC